MVPKKKATLIITNIGQLVTMQGPVPRLGDDMKNIGLVENGAVAVAGEEILAAGKAEEVERDVELAEGCRAVDARGKVVTPGLIDPHTHPVFSKTRQNEFEMRILGKSYQEIAAAGGGIRSSVRDLRETPVADLTKRTTKTLENLLRHGITTIEAKSGYGLSTEAEIKSLEIIQNLNETQPLDLIPTFLGAHEVPDEYRDKRGEYIDLLINEMMPKVRENNLAEFCDIFTEDEVFNIEESRKIMTAAKKQGFKLKFHAEELGPTGGAELAAELAAISADHLVHITDNGIDAMAKAGTAAVLLPGTCFSLNSAHYAPARKMIQSGVIVALSTDCNPGSSYTESLSMIISLAALKYGMTAAESLSAVTVNAACALDRGGKIGQLIPGLPADVVVWDMEDYRELPYHYGVNLVKKVIKRGKMVLD